MYHIRTGLRRILEVPSIYNYFQRLVGGSAADKRLVNEFLRPFAGARLLDLGCGTGHMLGYLPDTVEYVGIDMNEHYIDSARARYGPRGRFFCSLVEEMEGIEEDAGMFDIILARGLLHHIGDAEADGLFRCCQKVLKPTGYMISLDPVFLQGQSFFARYIMRMDRGQCVRAYEDYLKLPSPYFASVKGFIVKNMIRLPYTHLVMRMSKA